MNRRGFLINTAIAAAVGEAKAQSPTEGRSGSGPSVIVVGAGAFGGWTAFYMRRAGSPVTLVDAFGPGNSRSSSGGETRLLRADYGDQVAYTKMALRAFQLWKQWQQEWAVRLLVPTGRLLLGAETVRGEFEKRRTRLIGHGIPSEILGHDELRRRWPQIHTEDVPLGLYNPPEPSGSLLMARDACRAVAAAFERNGGTFRTARVEPGRIARSRLESVRLQNGDAVRADVFVFACGPWFAKIFPTLFRNRLRVTRRDVFYVGTPPGDERFSYPNLPTWGAMNESWYGFPSVDGRGLKACPAQEESLFDPDSDERLVNPSQTKRAHDHVARRFPALRDQPIVESRVCQVADSPDGNFVIDRHPDLNNVWLAGAGSGHGFKHGPALGEYLSARILRHESHVEWDSLFQFKQATF